MISISKENFLVDLPEGAVQEVQKIHTFSVLSDLQKYTLAKFITMTKQKGEFTEFINEEESKGDVDRLFEINIDQIVAENIVFSAYND